MAHLYNRSPAPPSPLARASSGAGSSTYLDRIVSATNAAATAPVPRKAGPVFPVAKDSGARMIAEHSRAAVRQSTRQTSQRWHPFAQRYGVAPLLEAAASDVSRRAAGDTPSPPQEDEVVTPLRTSPPPPQQQLQRQLDTQYDSPTNTAQPTASMADVVRRLYSRPRWLAAVPVVAIAPRGEAEGPAAVRHPYDAALYPAAAPATARAAAPAAAAEEAVRPRSVPLVPPPEPAPSTRMPPAAPPPQPREADAAVAASLAFAQSFLVEYEALSRRDVVIDFFVTYPTPPRPATPLQQPPHHQERQPPAPLLAATQQLPVRKPPPQPTATPSPPPPASVATQKAQRAPSSRKPKRAAKTRPADLGEPRRFRLVFPGALWSFVLRHHRPLLARALRRDAEAVLRPGECVEVLTLRADDVELEVQLAVQEWPGTALQQQPTAASLSHSSFTGAWDVYKVVAFFLSRDGAPAAPRHPPAAPPPPPPPPPSYDAIAGSQRTSGEAYVMPSAVASTRAASPVPLLAPAPLPPPPPVLRKYQVAPPAATTAALPAGASPLAASSAAPAPLVTETCVPLLFPTDAQVAVRRLTEEAAPQLRLALRRDAMYAVPGADQVQVQTLQVRGDGLFAELLLRSTEVALVPEDTTTVRAVEQSPFAETWDLLRAFITPVTAAPIVIRDAAAVPPAETRHANLQRADQATMVSPSLLLGRGQTGGLPALDDVLERAPRSSDELAPQEDAMVPGEARGSVLHHHHGADHGADVPWAHSPANVGRGAAAFSRQPSLLVPKSRRPSSVATPQRAASLLASHLRAGTSPSRQRVTQHTQTEVEAGAELPTSEEEGREGRAHLEEGARPSAAFPGSAAFLPHPSAGGDAVSFVTEALEHNTRSADVHAATESASATESDLRDLALHSERPSAARPPSQQPAVVTLAQVDAAVLATMSQQSAATLLAAMQESERSHLLASLAATPRSLPRRQSERQAAVTLARLESGVLPHAWEQSAAALLGAMQESEKSYAESAAALQSLLQQRPSAAEGPGAAMPRWHLTPPQLSASSVSLRSRVNGPHAAQGVGAADEKETASSRQTSSPPSTGHELQPKTTQAPPPSAAWGMSLSAAPLWTVLPRHVSQSSTPEQPASAAAQSANSSTPVREDASHPPPSVQSARVVSLPKDCFSSGEPSMATLASARPANMSTSAPDADTASPLAATTSPTDSPGLAEESAEAVKGVPVEVEVARLRPRQLGGPLPDISLASLQVTEASPAVVEAVVLVAPPEPTPQGTRLSFAVEGEKWGPLLDEVPVLLRRALQADVEAICGVPPEAMERVTLTYTDKLRAEVIVAPDVSLRPVIVDPRSTARSRPASSKSSTVVAQQSPSGEMSHMWALYDQQSQREMRPPHSPVMPLIASVRETPDVTMQRRAVGGNSVLDASAMAVTVNPVEDIVTPSAQARPRRPVPVFQLCLPGAHWGRLLAERGDDVTEAAVLDVGSLLASATAEATLEAMSITDAGALRVDFAVPIAALPCGLNPPQFRWALDRLPLVHLRELHKAAAATAPTRIQLRRFFAAEGLTEARVEQEEDVVRSVFLAETCALLDTTDDAVEELQLSGHLTVDVTLCVPTSDLIDDWREAVAEHDYPQLHDLLHELVTTRAVPRAVVAQLPPPVPESTSPDVPTPPVSHAATPATQAAVPPAPEAAPTPVAVPEAAAAVPEPTPAALETPPTESDAPAEPDVPPAEPSPPRRRSTPLLSASTLLVSPTASSDAPETNEAAAVEASAHAVRVEGEAWASVIEQYAEVLRESLACDAAASLAALRVTVQRVSTVPYARGALFTFLLQRPAACALRAIEDALQVSPLTAAWALFRRVAAAAAHAETAHMLRLDGAEWGRVVSAHAGAVAETFAWEALQCLRASEAVTVPVSVAVTDVSADADGLRIAYEVVSTSAGVTLDRDCVGDAVAAAPFPQLWALYDALMLAQDPFTRAKNADYVASRRQRHLSTAYDAADSPCVRRYSPVAWSAALSSDPLESYLATVQPEQLVAGDADEATAAAAGSGPAAAVAEDQLEYERLCLQVALPALPPPPAVPAVTALDAASLAVAARTPPTELPQPQQLTTPPPAAVTTTAVAHPASAASAATPNVQPIVARAADVAAARPAGAPPGPPPTAASPPTQPSTPQPTMAVSAAAAQPFRSVPPLSPPTATPQSEAQLPAPAPPRAAPMSLAVFAHTAPPAPLPEPGAGELTSKHAGPSAPPKPHHRREHSSRAKEKRRKQRRRRRSAETEATTAGPASAKSSSLSDAEAEERLTPSVGSSDEDTVLDAFTNTAPPPQMVRFLPPVPPPARAQPVVMPQLRQPHAVVARRAMPAWERGTATVIRIAGVPPPRPALPSHTAKPVVRRAPSTVHLPVSMPAVASPDFDPPGADGAANDPAPLPPAAASPSLQSRRRPESQKRSDARPAKPKLDSTPSFKKTSPPRRPGSSTGGDESARGLPELAPTHERSISQKSTDSQPALPQLHPSGSSRKPTQAKGPGPSARGDGAAVQPRRAYVVSMPVEFLSSQASADLQRPADAQPAGPRLHPSPSFRKRTTSLRRPGSSTRGDEAASLPRLDGALEPPELVPTKQRSGSQKSTDSQPALPQLRPSPSSRKPTPTRGPGPSARGETAARLRRADVVSMPEERGRSGANTESQLSTDAQPTVPRLHPVPSFKKTTPPRRPGSSTRGDEAAEAPLLDGASQQREFVSSRTDAESQRSTDSQFAVPRLRHSPSLKKPTPTRGSRSSTRGDGAAPQRPRATVSSAPEDHGRSGADSESHESTDAKPAVPRLHPSPSFMKKVTPLRRLGSSMRGDEAAQLPLLDKPQPQPLVPLRVGPGGGGGGAGAGATSLPVLHNVHSKAPIAVLDVRMTHAPVTTGAIAERPAGRGTRAAPLPQLGANRAAAPTQSAKVVPASQRAAPPDLSLSGQTSSRRSRSPQMLTSTTSSSPESVGSGQASMPDGPAAPALQGASTKPPRRPSSSFVVVAVDDTTDLQAVQDDVNSMETAMRSRYPRLERELIAATGVTVPPGS